MDKINSVHTFDCRDNVMFQVMKEMMDIPNDKMLSEIQGYLELLRTHLSKKGIEYNDLKSCLVPNQERKEVALVFDRNKIEDSWYGAKVFEKLVPLLNPDSKHSFLTGDFIVSNPTSEKVRDIFLAQVNTHSEVDYVASNQFYVIYINNITEKGVEDITNGLREWSAYVGYADMTYNSVLKTLFSRCLVQTLIKYGKVIIQSSCGEDPELEINTMGYCFDDYGYSFICVDDDMYGVFPLVSRDKKKSRPTEVRLSLSSYCATYFRKNSSTGTAFLGIAGSTCPSLYFSLEGTTTVHSGTLTDQPGPELSTRLPRERVVCPFAGPPWWIAIASICSAPSG